MFVQIETLRNMRPW